MSPRGRAWRPPAPDVVPDVVLVSTSGGPHPVSRQTVDRRARKMLLSAREDGLMPDVPAELSVALVDDATIAELNRAYRQKSRPTDVLAFPMDPLPEGPHLLGDVIISIPTAARQAAKAKRPLLEEVTMLLGHGLLHLLGFDHRTRAEEKDMKARTARLEAAARSRSRPS